MKILFLFCVLAFAAGNNNDEKAAEELTKDLEQYQKQAEQVLDQVDKIGKIAPPVSPQKIDDTKQKALKLANDDRFLKAAEGLWQNDARNKMLAIQGAFFLFMMLFKAWRNSRPKHWFRKLIANFFFSLVTWAGLLYVIPLLVLGEPFGIFTGTLWRVLVMGG